MQSGHRVPSQSIMLQCDGMDLATQLEAGDRRVNRGADGGRLGRGDEKGALFLSSK